MAGTVVFVHHRLRDQREEVDEAFCEPLEITLWSQALVRLGYFNHPGICWRDSTAQHTQSRKFLQFTEDNFFMQAVEEPAREGVLLDLGTNKEGSTSGKHNGWGQPTLTIL